MWLFRAGKAHNRQTVTYGELARMMGFKGSGVLGPILGRVLEYCRLQGLPLLTVLVVNSDTGLPSFNVETDMNRAREDVYRFNWFDVVPPLPEALAPAYDELRRGIKNG